MPTIRIELLEGRTAAQKQAFMSAVTDAAVRDLGSAPEHINVVFSEVPRHHWATGGKFWSESSQPIRPG
jgi:4-oxalocrotonate tautomerase